MARMHKVSGLMEKSAREMASGSNSSDLTAAYHTLTVASSPGSLLPPEVNWAKAEGSAPGL